MRPMTALLACAVSLSACAIPRGTAYNPHPPPPPPRREAALKPPVTEELLILQPGHWEWTGSGYVWETHRFVPREGHGSLWLDGHWVIEGGDWAWAPGRWV